MRIAILIYPHFSLQEITCLTSCLALWYGEKLDFLGSECKVYESEEGFQVLPTKRVCDVSILDYDCIILPGMIDPLPALYDQQIISFLQQAKNTNIIMAAISAAPLLLAKASLLDEAQFTAGFFMQMMDVFPFLHPENYLHRPVVEDRQIITAIGFAFREFAIVVLQKLGYEVPKTFLCPIEKSYSEAELTFYWEEADYQEFLQELATYEKE